ncbi:MAG: hypothetical protein WBF13_06710 [Candidatus Zixiibacteriota bacterium]
MTRDSYIDRLGDKGSFYSAEVFIDDLDSVFSFLNGKDNKRKECASPAIGVAVLVGSGFREPAHGQDMDEWLFRGIMICTPYSHSLMILTAIKITTIVKPLDTSDTARMETEAEALLAI